MPVAERKSGGTSKKSNTAAHSKGRRARRT
jgi:hypothetical protein